VSIILGLANNTYESLAYIVHVLHLYNTCASSVYNTYASSVYNTYASSAYILGLTYNTFTHTG
jgi:hypothetical protein